MRAWFSFLWMAPAELRVPGGAALDDLPLAKIASAAQGYTRLDGRAAAFPGKPLMSPVGREPCCWYSYRILTYDRDGDVTSTEHETTDWSFMMSDGSGECVVDPV